MQTVRLNVRDVCGPNIAVMYGQWGYS